MITVEDGNSYESFDKLSDAWNAAINWYSDGGFDEKVIVAANNNFYDGEVPGSIRKAQDKLNETLENIAIDLGYNNFCGHGNYCCSASSQAGLFLTIKEEE